MTSCPEKPFGVGCTLHELSAVSTDENWSKEGFGVNVNTIYKLLKLGHFGSYCVTSSASYLDLNEVDMAALFASEIAMTPNVHPKKQYIMNPVSGLGKLTWLKAFDITRPTYDLNVEFDDLAFNLDDHQYATFMSIFGTLTRQSRAYPYRKFRPPLTITPKMDPKSWFQYAIRCVHSDIHTKRHLWTWEHFKTRRDERKMYIELYTELRMDEIDIEQIEELKLLEMSLSYDDIRLYRHLAMSSLKVKKPILAASPVANAAGSPNSGWYGWITGATTLEETENDDWNLQLQKIYENFDFDEVQNDGVYPVDSCRLKISSRLASGSFNLRMWQGEEVSDLVISRFENLRIDHIGYPKSMEIQLFIEQFVVSEPENTSAYHTLIEAKHEVSGESKDFFNLNFQHLPLDGRADNALAIKMLPLRILVNPTLINKVFAFFKPKKGELDSISRIQAAAQGAFNGVTAQSKTGLMFAIEEHKTLDLSIEADAPVFIIPSDDLSGSVLILDAGHMHVKSDIVNQQAKARAQGQLLEKSLLQLAKDIYDKFVIDFTSANIMLAELDQSSKTIAFKNQDHFLEDLDLSLRIDVSILPNAAEFPKFKFLVLLPRLHLNVSEKKLLLIKSVANILSETFLGNSNSVPVISGGSTADASAELWIARNELAIRDATEALREGMFESEPSDTIISEQQTLFEFSCKFNQTSIALFDHSSPIAVFEASDLQVDFVFKNNDSALTATLGGLVMRDSAPGAVPAYSLLVSSEQSKLEDAKLLSLEYRSKKTLSEGENTDIDITVNPIKFVFARECILKVFHIASAITANSATVPKTPIVSRSLSTLSSAAISTISSTHATLKIVAISVLLAETASTVGSCSLEGIELTLNSTQDIMFITGTVGKLSIFQEEESMCMLLIEEDRAIDFEFETFDHERALRRGYDSSLTVNAASWRFVYDQQYLVKLGTYFEQLQEMRSVIEGARQAAMETQQQMQESAGKFYIKFNVQTPIIVVPNGRSANADSLLFFPGQITAESALISERDSEMVLERYSIAINSLKLQSAFYHPDGVQCRDMVRDLNLEVVFDSMKRIPNIPQKYITFNLSDVHIEVSNHQYRLFAEIVQLITATQTQPAPNPSFAGSPTESSHMEVSLLIPNLTFEAYICPTKFSNPEQYSLARFLGSAGSAKFSTISDGTLDFELCFSNLSILDTRISNSAFRDIMTPIKGSSDDQFVLSYNANKIGAEYSVTIDRPKLILEIDHILAIRSFAVSAWFHESDRVIEPLQSSLPNVEKIPQVTLKGKVNFIEAEIIIIAQPSSPDTDAVIMITQHLLVVQDSVMTVSFQDLGMFFCVMSHRAETELRFLDNCNLTYILDDRLRPDGIHVNNSSIETTKLLFRVSHQDILLLSDLIERIRNSTAIAPPQDSDGNAVIVVANQNLSEQFRVSIESIQALLIDDLSDLHIPLFEFGLDRTIFEMSNWSSKFEFSLGLLLFANYFNVKNSHWEPMIESSQFSISGKNDTDGKREVSLLCRNKLEINLSHVLVETVLDVMEKLPKQEVSRRIVNF